MILPITGIIHFIDFIIFSFCAWKLNAAFIKSGKRNLICQYFSLFFLFTAIFQLMIGLGHLPIILGFPDAFPVVFNWAYIIGHIFLYLGMAYFIYVPSYLYFKNSEFTKKITKVYFYLIILMGLIITVINILNPLISPYVDAQSGLTFFNVPEQVGKMIPIIVLFSWAPASLLFLYEAVKLKGFPRYKSLLLGVGLIVIIVGGPMHDVARDAGQYFFADMLTLIGFFILFFSIFIKNKNQTDNNYNN